MDYQSKDAASGSQQYLYKEEEKQQQKPQPKPVDANFNFSFAKQDSVEKELRKPRSKAYTEIFAAIDMLSATDEEIIERLKANMDEDTAEEFAGMTMEELLEEIKLSFREEFQSLEVPVETVLNGVISKCYITGCDVHAIDPEGNILNHFEAGKPLPDMLAPGRVVYQRYPECSCVEVYNNCCRVIQNDGEVITIPNSDI